MRIMGAPLMGAEELLRKQLREATAREERLLQRLAEHVRHNSVPPAPMVPQSGTPSLRARMPQWAGIAAVIAALGGGAGVAQVLRPPPYNPGPQLDDIRQDAARIESKVDKIIERDERKTDNDGVRWGIVQGALCNLNAGKPFARGVDCNAVVWDQPPLGQTLPWKAREDWPRPERPPAYGR